MALYDINGKELSADFEVDPTLSKAGEAADAKVVGDTFNALGVSPIEPSNIDVPRVYVDGTLPTSKDQGKLTLSIKYVSNSDTFDGWVQLKVQGDSSASYPKKNFNVNLFEDEACTAKLKVNLRGWGKSNKYTWKANWIDITQARNVVNGRLWGEICASRSDIANYPIELIESPNYGTVDGFNMILFVNGEYWGRYTWNLKKDTQMFNMDDAIETNACLIADANSLQCLFRATPTVTEDVDWTDELHGTAPAGIVTSFQNFVSFVQNSTDAQFKANIEDYCYLTSLIDRWIYAWVIEFKGGFAKSQRFDTYDGTKWIAGTYDMDTTWMLQWNGDGFYSSMIYPTDYYTDTPSNTTNLLWDRVVALFSSEIKTRYAELRQGALSNANIISLFETFWQTQTPDLIAEDYASTTGEGNFTNIPSKATNTKQKLRQIIYERLAYCDANISAIGS